MSLALYVNLLGNLEQIAAGETLNIDDIDVAGTGHLTIGESLGAGDELQLGNSGGTSGTGDVRVYADLRVDNDLYVTGSSAITVDETVTGTFTANGDVNLGSGDGDQIDVGGGGTDVVNIAAGTVNLDSDLTLGDNLIDIGSSTTDFLKDLWVSTIVGGAGAGVSLKGTGNGTSGSEAVGVYTTGLTISPATDDLQTVIEALDSAITAGGGESLQQTYAIGNTIAVTTANGALQFSNAADVTDVLEVSRTFAGAGIGIDVQMGPSNEAVTGVGVSITSGTGATGDMLFVNNLGSGDALDVQDGGGSVLQVTGAGAVNITPTSGQNATITAAGAASVDINAGATIELDATGGGISLDAAGASNFTTSSGNLTLDAAAGQLVFDDVGGSGLTLSQAGDLTLDTSGVLSGATSIIGSLNRLADELDSQGADQFVTYTLEGSTTSAVGDVLAWSATGVLELADATTNQKLAGVAREATGPGGSVQVWTPGALCTGSGFTPGEALFLPATPGIPENPATTTAGDVVQRIGWALSATQYILDPAPPVIL